ncbi:hypothetical protein WP8W18E11_07690 [Acinetobacter baumannii]|nr:hypothetical protein [Acinetobacter baumannii]BBT48239.1 hypothetical protein WP8W18E11_07690 [Acinetobacter baumannii]
MKKTIFSLIFATCAAFSNSIQAEEVYYQQEDIAYAFELERWIRKFEQHL